MARRNTIQKQLVIAAVRSLENHPTADEVYNCIISEYPDISKGTVYRNLNTLVETGLLNKIAVPSGADRYDHILTKHYHIQCMNCGAFEEVETKYIKDLDGKISQSTGYQIENRGIVFSGICPKCQKVLAKKK